ncbi:DUF305 domain-containing protein [Mycolicibacterium sp.]|uniref:DUF305 domain-containing protein n=1 Tax=Mycolicibacterium sp. TaxID=2320850 RepID=UPI003D1134DE
MNLKRLISVGAAAVAAAAAVGACSNTAANGHDMSSMNGSETSSAASATGGDSAPTYNDADVTFTQGMIPHHQQAIAMSDMMLAKSGIDPRVVSLATQIKAAQGPEIETMQGWLTDWNVTTTTSAPGTSSMPGMADMPGHDMGGGGAMSDQAMAELQNAQGIAASKLFLAQMIEHHNGAIVMAKTEVAAGQFQPATEMARAIVTSQQQEVDTMQQMLGSL